MQVLIVGGGGREHALAWKVAQSAAVETVYVAPGNAGTALEPKVKNIPLRADDVDGLRDFAQQQRVDLTIVGPEVSLVAGIVDCFTSAGLRCFGPSQAAARLEGSKAFCKDFLQRHGIPTAAYRTFTDLTEAEAYLQTQPAPVVIKADGLAAGKGVILAQSVDEAQAAVRSMLAGDAFGAAGRRVVIEEFLQGEEASFICMVDGDSVLPLATSQDHKALNNGDTGPNTGGMGAYSPAPVVTSGIHDRILRDVIEPTVQGMAAEGNPYRGFLYAGLMISAEGIPKVLEYNVRLGDPETQPIMLRLRSDLVALCAAALDDQLREVKCQWDQRAALGVVLAAGGYPASFRTGDPISGLPEQESESLKVFHAGTAFSNGTIVTAGGRVLCVASLGNTIGEARQTAYEEVKKIHWEGMYYRTDIGHRAIDR